MKGQNINTGLKKHEILGIILMILSLIVFVVYMWWATTDTTVENKGGYGVGIFVFMSFLFFSGIGFLYNPFGKT